MSVTAFRVAAVLAVFSTLLILSSCSGESGPQPGTPAFNWAAAKQTFAAGDYEKTVDNLDKIAASENEFTAKAQPWLMVLCSGMSRGYMELADRYEAGTRANKTDPTTFRRSTNSYRGQASRQALHFAQVFGNFQKTKPDNVPMAFGYPTGNPTPTLVLTKVASGILPAPADVEAALKQNVQRGVLLAACDAVGAHDDPAKAQAILKSENPQVPRAVFVTAMANALYDQSQIYSRMKMDDPDKMKMFCIRAQEALKTIPESKETKELNGKITKVLKTSRS